MRYYDPTPAVLAERAVRLEFWPWRSCQPADPHEHAGWVIAQINERFKGKSRHRFSLSPVTVRLIGHVIDMGDPGVLLEAFNDVLDTVEACCDTGSLDQVFKLLHSLDRRLEQLSKQRQLQFAV